MDVEKSLQDKLAGKNFVVDKKATDGETRTLLDVESSFAEFKESLDVKTSDVNYIPEELKVEFGDYVINSATEEHIVISNNHMKLSHQGIFQHTFSGENKDTTTPLKMPDYTTSVSFIEEAEFFIGCDSGRKVFLHRDGDTITNFGICAPNNSTVPVFSTRGNSVAYRTSATSCNFIADIAFADLDSNSVTEIKDVPVHHAIERVIVISNKHILIVGQEGEIFIYDSSGEQVSKLESQPEAANSLVQHVELSGDTRWLFICYFDLDAGKPKIVTFEITMENDITRKGEFEFSDDFKGDLKKSIGCIHAGLNHAGRTIVLVQKSQGTVIDSENDFHYEGPLEVLVMDDEGTPVSLKTIPIRYVRSRSIASDR